MTTLSSNRLWILNAVFQKREHSSMDRAESGLRLQSICGSDYSDQWNADVLMAIAQGVVEVTTTDRGPVLTLTERGREDLDTWVAEQNARYSAKV